MDTPVHGWTLDTLKAYIEVRFNDMETLYNERFESQKQAVTSALASAERAVGKAEVANEKRFDSVNEFRSSLADQAATLMPRLETESRIGVLDDKVDALNARLDRHEGVSKGLTAGWGYLLAAIGATGALVGIILSIISLA